jgi:nickel/cobalt transporter (NicO) family protein
MKAVAGDSSRLAKLILAVAVILLAADAVDAIWVQGSPFGVPRPQSAPPPPTSGMLGWIFAKQAEFYRALSGAIRAAKADGSAA